jgi:hypothetical protein
VASVATQPLALSGADPTYSAASGGGDRFTPGQSTFLHVKNGSGSSINATLTVVGKVEDLTPANRVVAVPAGADRKIPLPADLYASADGLGDIAWSATTTVSFAVLRAI